MYSNDGFQTYLTVNQNETSLAEREGEGGFSDSITLVVEKKGSQGQPGQPTDNRIRLQLDGDACTSFADMVSKDIQIYVSKDGGSSFSQLTGLDTNSTKEYVFEADITSVKFYVSCDETKYSLQFPGKSGDAGKSEQTAIALNAAGTGFQCSAHTAHQRADHLLFSVNNGAVIQCNIFGIRHTY